MATFNYSTIAELLPTRNESELLPSRSRKRKHPIGYGRFARAPDAIRFAIEELPPQLLLTARLEVGEVIFEREEIRRLYESDAYPLARRATAR